MNALFNILLGLVRLDFVELWANPLFWITSTTIGIFGYAVYLKAIELAALTSTKDGVSTSGFIYRRDILCETIQTETTKSRLEIRRFQIELNRLRREEKHLNFQSLPAHLKSDILHVINELDDRIQKHQRVVFRLHDALEEVGKVSNQYHYQVKISAVSDSIKRQYSRVNLYKLPEEKEQPFVQLLNAIEISIQDILNGTYDENVDEHDFI